VRIGDAEDENDEREGQECDIQACSVFVFEAFRAGSGETECASERSEFVHFRGAKSEHGDEIRNRIKSILAVSRSFGKSGMLVVEESEESRKGIGVLCDRALQGVALFVEENAESGINVSLSNVSNAPEFERIVLGLNASAAIIEHKVFALVFGLKQELGIGFAAEANARLSNRIQRYLFLKLVQCYLFLFQTVEGPKRQDGLQLLNPVVVLPALVEDVLVG